MNWKPKKKKNWWDIFGRFSNTLWFPPRPENWVLWVKMLLWTRGVGRTGNNDVHKNVSDRLNLVNVSQGFASALINLLHFDFYGHTSRVLNQLSIRENPISQKPSFSENSARFFSPFPVVLKLAPISQCPTWLNDDFLTFQNSLSSLW